MENYSYSCIEVTMLEFRPLVYERWPELQSLFESKGACAGCWCMYWRLSYRAYENGKGLDNKTQFLKLIRKGAPLGILAFQDDIPIGWCSVSPKRDLVRLETSRLFKTSMVNSTWCITCLYINKDHRNKGTSAELIAAASKYAFENGAINIEAYPIVPKQTRIPAAFAWVGLANSFYKAGFKKIDQPSTNRLIVRLEKPSDLV